MTAVQQDLSISAAGVRIEQVDLSYGDNHVLKSVNLDIRPGEFFAFLGPYLDPSTASVSQLPQVQISGGNISFSFAEPSGVSGITYGAQWSATLQANDWHAITDTGDASATPPQHLFSVPIGRNTQLFMRLTVSVQ